MPDLVHASCADVDDEVHGDDDDEPLACAACGRVGVHMGRIEKPRRLRVDL